MSLRSTLNQIIRDQHGEIVPINEIYAYCDKNHFKRSNAERRLRASESPNIERVMKHGAIIGYRYLEPGPDVKEWFKPPCCSSIQIYGIHSRDCEKVKVRTLL